MDLSNNKEGNLEENNIDIIHRGTYVILILLLANFFRNLGSSIVDIGLPKFVLSLSGSLASYGIIVGIFSIFQAIFQFPLAAASDRYGRKLVISIGISIYIIGTFLCFFAQTILQLIIFRAIQGAGAYSSIIQAIIGERYEKEYHGKAMSYYSFSLSLGYFGGIAIGGYVAYFFGFRNIFLFSGILALISGLLIFIFLKDDHIKKHNYINNNLNEKINEENLEQEHIKLKDIKKLMKDPQYRFSIFINWIRWFLFSGIVVYLIWVLQVDWNLDQIQTSQVMVLIVLVYISFVLYSGRLIDKFGTKPILCIGQIIIIVFGSMFIIVSMTHNLPLFIIASILSGIGFALYQTGGNTHLLKVIHNTYPELKGSGLGFNNALGFLFGALGPVIICPLGEFWAYLPYYFISIFILISLLITLKFLKIQEI